MVHKKKILAFSVPIAVILLVLVGVVIYRNTSANPYTTLTGVSMSPEVFEEAYVPDRNEAVIDAFVREEKLRLKNLKVQNQILSVSAQLLTSDKQTVDFDIIGSLYSGLKKQVYGIPSIVLDTEEEANINGIKMLFFEIVNGTDDKILCLDLSLAKKPNIKIYLDFEGKLYLFEGELPKELADIQDSGLEEMPDILQDTMWSARYVEGEASEIHINDE